MLILTVLSYATNLLDKRKTGNTSGISATGGQSPFATSTLFYPNLLGPFFIIATVSLFTVGCILLVWSMNK